MLALASVAGDIAAWFAAIGTVGTLLWLVFERVRRQEEARELAFRAQASKIVYWPVLLPDGALEFIVRNAGELPVYDAVLVSDDVFLASARNLVIGVLPPGDTHRSVPQEDLGDRDKLRFGLSQSAGVLSRGLWFTDGQGVRWIRDSSGSLAEASRVLVKRDLRVLRGLYAVSDDGNRAAQVASIAREAGIRQRTAERRLARLRAHGLVRIHVSKPAETWWRLTSAGEANAKKLEAGDTD